VWRRKSSLTFGRPWKAVHITIEREGMPRKATPEEAVEVNAILSRVNYDTSPFFGSNEEWRRACYYAKAFKGYVPNSGGCSSCRHEVHDILREAVGLGVARRPTKEARYQERLATCHECPAYHSTTDSCGRLFIDALSPKPVAVDGENVYPCGCIVSLKAKFSTETCPANRWKA